jgi:predicted ATPase/class 3 adenylate cyclase
VAELPRGTVTFLFTDIEGSTRLLHELGDGYAGVLAQHRRALREAFRRHGGVEVDTQGDAFFVAFGRAADAVAAAADAQRALEPTRVRVRMGIHTGEPMVTEEGYVGGDVHRAARVMSAGHGGQVLVSEATARLLDSQIELSDLGEHRLKDLSAPERLYQLGEREFPPLRTLYRTNLPVVTTPLIGRERELEEAGALVRSHRLLTLTGPGGSGKTRLAVHLAADAAEQFPDGVFWVPLQAIRDPAIVENTIAAAVGAEDGLVGHIGSKRMLVLLDNFEQVIEAAPTVSSLLAGTPNAKVLVTSREPLQVASERRYPVDPLRADDAEVLFVARAQAVAPDFGPTRTVALICERLDRLPLAIELAAARVALLDPDDLLARLEQRLPLLASRSRDAPARQRTLRATIEWSYELLEPEEQQLFRRTGVFRGSFTLETVEAVCDADLDTVESLVVKNLLRRRWGSGRLLMLDTIREYAAEQFEQSAEADKIHRRHAEFFLSVFEDANLNAGRLDVRRPMRPDIAVAEQDNLRGALAWTAGAGRVALGLALATAADWFWVLEDPNEGKRWFGRLFEGVKTESVDPVLRAYALLAYAGSTDISGDNAAAGQLYEESYAVFEELADDHGRALLLHRLGLHAMRRGEFELARALVEESHALHEQVQDGRAKKWRHAETTGTLGAIARDRGDAENARRLIAESAALARAAGVPWWEGGMLAELAALSFEAGHVEEAESRARESLVIADQLHDRAGRVFAVGLLARGALERGQLERAGRLWGAIENEDAGAPLGGWRRHREAQAARMEDLGPEFERGRVAGHELDLDEAVEEALTRA